MSLLRPFSACDLFKFNNVNLDPWTETYSISYYLQYLATWPDLINVAEAPNGSIMGYGLLTFLVCNSEKLKPYQDVDCDGEDRRRAFRLAVHGHVSAITVAPSYRRLSLARSMMNLFESASDRQGCKFVDLYVRISNDLAIGMYESFGYSVFRRVLNYYSGQEDDEDAFDMRKSLSSDPDGLCVRSDGRSVIVSSPY